PWEIMTKDGQFCAKDTFPIKDKPWAFELFQQIWRRAQYALNTATKVSFVGISMHPFMKLGLEHLFRTKEGECEVVVANNSRQVIDVPATSTSNEILPAGAVTSVLDPRSPAGRVDAFFNKLRLKHFEVNEIRPVDSFKTFI